MKCKKLAFLLVLVFFPISLAAQNQDSIEGDRQALTDLYSATGGDNWINNSGWLNGDPSDSWFGVQVNSEGRVIRLNLPENNLVGELPSSIGNLNKLEFINIKQNGLTGEIPSEIGNWTNIHTLYLSGREAGELPNPSNRDYHAGKSDNSGNSFSGEFPDVFANFPMLEVFQLSGTDMTKIFHESIGLCTNLIQIEVSWNVNNDQELPSSISELVNLKRLQLRTNNMQGPLPDLSNLTDLRYFHVGNGNNFSGDLPDFSNNTKLRSFNIDQNSFTGEWPHYWNNGEFTTLHGLRASWNSFTGTLHGFENLDLTTFAIDGSNLTGPIPESITTNDRLIILSLGWNNFTGQIPQDGWKDHNRTRYLRFSSNDLTGPIPNELPDSDRLQYLYFQNNNLSGTISTNHAKYADSNTYSRFNWIDISNNRFHEEEYQSLLDELGSSKLIVGDQNPD